ncbi:MAG: fibronectin, partial [Candidatus Planktophila sp.]
MRAGITRTPRVGMVALVLLALLAPITPPASAQSLFRYAPATQWGYTYAGPSTAVTTAAIPKSANLEKQANINVNYTNFPEWAKKELQAAVDVWAENFQSKVTITIDATWSSSQSIA